jgi:hypothetical protein
MPPGPRGPVPKRSEERRRRNKDVEIDQVSSGTDLPCTPPEPDMFWHPVATRWYESLAESGQAIYYEPSDWMVAFYTAEAMTRNLNSGQFSGHLFAAVQQAMTSLLCTEGDRRRLRLELTRGEVKDTESAGVIALRDYKKALGG